MIIILLTYTAPLSEVDKYLQSHREFLDYYYKQNLLIASGPMKPRTGGVIVALSKDKAYIEQLFKKDPYALAGIASYQFIEFSATKHCEQLNELIEKMEGKQC